MGETDGDVSETPPPPPPQPAPIAPPPQQAPDLVVTEQGKGTDGKVKGTENRKKLREEKRKKGSGQLAAPDEKKVTTETGTVNTGDAPAAGGAGGQSNTLNIKQNK